MSTLAPSGVRTPPVPLVLAVLCVTTFVTSANASGLTPFLLDIARAFGLDLPLAGSLVALTSVAWGVGSVLAGLLSDRIGRRPVLLGSLLLATLAPFGTVLAPSFAAAATSRLLGGFGGGAYMGVVFAAVSDLVPVQQRGRALGWLVVGQSLALLLGVPLLTLLGADGGWRRALAWHGAAALAAVVAVWLVVPARRASASGEHLPVRRLLQQLGPRTLALLGASTFERVCYSGMVVFLPTFLLVTYGTGSADLALGLAIVAVGNLVGNVLGGQAADRAWPRPWVVAGSSAMAGLFVLLVFLWQPGLWGTVAVGLLFTLANALGRPAMLAALSEGRGSARGAVLGLNITFSSWGWIIASLLGGWLIGGSGFAAFGLFLGGMAALSAGAATLSHYLPNESLSRTGP